MRRHVIRTTVHTSILLAALACLPATSVAQTSPATSASAPLPANDSIFRRARRMVGEGNGASGRALVDSMVRATAEGTPDYGNAIFWRGALAETAADAERDYRRVIVEYPVSPYADDALLSLAELEQARGDRAAAYEHLVRFVREHPVSPARARAGLAAARLAFEQRDVAHGCTMIADARTSAGTSDVELRNQIDYYGARCPAATAAVAPPVATPAVVAPPAPTPAAAAKPVETKPVAPKAAEAKPVAAKPVATKPVATKPAPKPEAEKPAPTKPAEVSARGTWTIQLAAYNTRPDAERLVAKLAGRGVKARISGAAKPFRVRLDYYETRQAAAAAVADLKARGIIGFVTEEPRASGATTP